MKNQWRTTYYMSAVIAAGTGCLLTAVIYFPFEKLDIYLLILAAFTIAFGSRMTIKIPQFKSHIAVSDIFIFLAFLLFGGSPAVVLAALEAFCSAWRFCNKKITVFFNAAAMACSTSLLALIFYACDVHISEILHGKNYGNLIIALSVIALTQFIANSGLAAIYGALKSEKPLWETWKSFYLWTSITYFIGALGAGALAKLIDVLGFSVLLATVPIIGFVYFTYRMYLKNVEMSFSQAEQAERHAAILQTQAVALRESEERFRSAFNYAPIGIALVSPAGNWLKVNHALCKILDYNQDELLATDFHTVTHPEDLGTALVKIHEIQSGKTSNCQLEQRYLNKQRETVWVSWSASTVSDSAEVKPNLIFQIQDITDRKEAEAKLQYEATHDALTSLPNRAYFTNRLEQALIRTRNEANFKVSVLFIDLDRFKVINDSLGHLIGDHLLIGIAERLRECVRPTDTVARLGGDEFTILVEGAYENSEVLRIAERIQNKFITPFNINGNEIYSSASIGILHGAANHLKPEDLMRDADIAMYQAKRGGKARHEIFVQNMREEVTQALQLENDLRRTIENQELLVHYQPIFNLKTREIQGFEALARWQHPKFGMLSPNKFIPLAEEIGLIDALGEQILRQACVQGAKWQNFSRNSDLAMSVNLSCKQFANANLLKNIENVLNETGFAAENLKLEVTESVVLEHQERAVEMLHQLCRLGVEINIDDFGTGYSNLNYLVQLPVSTLKIDRSFISSMKNDGRNAEIVEIIVKLAQTLDMKVVAEGIETVSQLQKLKSLNCEGGQGYLFAKPMNAADATVYLRNLQRPLTVISNVKLFEPRQQARTAC